MTNLIEHAKHTWLSQSHYEHPKSNGPILFDGEKIQAPLFKSYPLKHEVHNPALLKVLHWSFTETHPDWVIINLYEHFKHTWLSQSHYAHPKSKGPTLLLSENIHEFSSKSYPL